MSKSGSTFDHSVAPPYIVEDSILNQIQALYHANIYVVLIGATVMVDVASYFLSSWSCMVTMDICE